MTRNPRKNIPGALAGIQNPKNIEKYENDRYKAARGKYLPSGAFNLQDEYIADESSIYYLSIIPRTIVNANVAYLGNLWTAAYPLGMKTGNMKEVNATEAAAAEAIFEDWTNIVFNLGLQQMILDLMDNPPRSDNALDLSDGVAGNVVIPVNEEDARNTLIGELEGLSECMPNATVKLWDAFKFYFKIRKEWIRGATNLPGAYLLPMAPNLSLTSLQTLKENIYSNSGLARNHMQKFGIPFKKFSRDMLHGRMNDISNGNWDVEAIGFFAEWSLPFTGDGAPAGETTIVPHNLLTGTPTSHKFYFPTGSKPDDIPLYKFWPLIQSYDNPDNIYGGLIGSAAGSTSSTAEDCLVHAAKTEATNWEALGFTTAAWIGRNLLPNFRCMCYGGCGEDNLTVSITGDYMDADVNINEWIAGNMRGYKYWSGFTVAQWEGVIKRVMSDLIYGGV
jgi:hypothetical protein